MAARDLIINLLANTTGFNGPLHEGRKALHDFHAEAMSGIGGISSYIAGAVGIGSVLGSIGWGVKLAADMEQLEISFGTMLGSSEAAKKMLGDLNELGAQTPFEFPELADAGKKLVAFGTPAEDIVDTLTRIGDVASGIGAPIGELSEIYGKIRVQNKLMSEDINQLQGRGIPIIDELSKVYGVGANEIKKMVTEGKVGFGDLEQVFINLTSEGGKFHGLMAAQSASVHGLFSTLKDTAGQTFRDIGQVLIDELDIQGQLSSWIEGISEFRETAVEGVRTIVVFWKEWGDELAAVGIAIVGVRTILWTITAVQKAIAAGQALVLSLAGPKGWAVLAAGAVIAAGAYMAIDYAMDNTVEQAKLAAEESKKVGQSAEDVKRVEVAAHGAAGGFKAIQTEVKTLTDLQKAYQGETAKLDADLKAISDAFDAGNISRDQAAMFEQMAIDKNTGIFGDLKKIQDELALVNGEATEAGLAMRDMLAKGVPRELAEEYARLKEELAQAKKDTEDADRMEKEAKDEVKRQQDDRQKLIEGFAQSAMTPADKLAAEFAQLESVKNELSPEAYARNLNRLQQQSRELQGKNNTPRDLTATEVNSREAVASLQQVLFGGSLNPVDADKAHQKKLEQDNQTLIGLDTQIAQSVKKIGKLKVFRMLPS